VNITGAQGILFNISGSSNLTLYEVTEAAEEIRAAADPEANIIFGASFDERLGEDVVITVIATGFDGTRRREPVRREAAERPYEVSRSARPERDYLGELERQRSAVEAEPRPAERPSIDRGEGTSVRVERTVAETSPASNVRRTYDADDLEIPSFLRRSK
jgi:cell division protein FtsZ